MVTKKERFRNLEDRLTEQIGIIPASWIAEIADDPSLKPTIRKIRAKDIGTKIGFEATGAFNTYALMNIVTMPYLYGAGIITSTGLDIIRYRAQAEFRYEVTTKLNNKLFKLLPYYQTINIELQDRGHLHANYFQLTFDIIKTEERKFGISKMLVLTRPLTQAFAAIGNIPKYVLAGSMALTYASLPFFSRIGKKDKIIEDRMHTVEISYQRTQLLGNHSFDDLLNKARKQFMKATDNNRLKKIFSEKIPDIAFLGAAAITKTDKIGVFRYISQLFSTPMGYRALRENEFDVKRSYGLAKSLYEILTGNPYLLTDSSWDKYRTEKIKTLKSITMENQGIIVDSLETFIPDKSGSRYASPLFFKAEPGEVVFLQGESGKGKSVTTGLGFAGVVKTKGTIYLKDKDSPTKPLEALTREELQKRVWYVAPSYAFNEIRVCDIYQKKIMDSYLQLNGKTQEDLNNYEILMLTVPDATLERELYALARDLKKSKTDKPLYGYDNLEGKKFNLEGINAVFPEDMFGDIYAFREARNKIVMDYLQTRGKNFEHIDPSEPIGHLSTGMKTRFMWEMHRELYGSNGGNGETKMIILDEPLGSLDKDNANEYLDMISELTNSKNPPIVILISHTHQDLIENHFEDKLKHVYYE
ncbi:MAG: hypothetical protein ACP5N3_01420 [Candidatus Nanoarchaeia archaeon]